MTTTCERCAERLVDHYYGELPLDETRATAEHLADCADCALEYCRLSAALAGFRALDREAPSPEVQVNLRKQVETEFRPSLGKRLLRLLAMRVPIYQPALLVILFFVLWTLVRSLAPHERGAATILERFDATHVDIVDHHVL
jgi:anti-sigma factor RsiW